MIWLAGAGVYLVAGVVVWWLRVNHQLPVWCKRGPFAVAPEDVGRYFETGHATPAFRRSMAFTRWLTFSLVACLWPLYLALWRRGTVPGRDPQ